jgi:hypothetical protein
MAINLYGISISVNGASTAANYNISLASDGTFVEGGVTIDPTAIAATLVSIYRNSMAISAPAASIGGGSTISTSADVVAGRVMVSPPVDVDTVVTLYGTDSIGSYTLKAGETSGAFSWSVAGRPALQGHDTEAFLGRVVPKLKAR